MAKWPYKGTSFMELAPGEQNSVNPALTSKRTGPTSCKSDRASTTRSCHWRGCCTSSSATNVVKPWPLENETNCQKMSNKDFSSAAKFQKLNPQFHWLRQITISLHKFHWQFWIFLDAIAKSKKLICESIAQNLKQVSLTKSFLALAMVFNLLLSNLT